MRAVPRRERLAGCDDTAKSSVDVWVDGVFDAGGEEARMEAAVCRTAVPRSQPPQRCINAIGALPRRLELAEVRASTSESHS